MSKIVILGAGGQLGSELSTIFPNALTFSHNRESAKSLEFERKDEFYRVLEEISPDIILNAAAFTKVDECEKNKDIAYSVNGDAVRTLVEVSRKMNSLLVHVSTDYVFDGEKGQYSETDTPNPVNYYGLSKLIGDTFALGYDNSIVVRASGIYGRSKNFPIFVYNKLLRKEHIDVLEGFYSPIHAKNLALSIRDIIKKDVKGTINISGIRISRLELAESLADRFHIDSPDISEVESIPGLIAKRPFDSSLDITKSKELLDFDFYSIESNLKCFEASIEKQ